MSRLNDFPINPEGCARFKIFVDEEEKDIRSSSDLPVANPQEDRGKLCTSVYENEEKKEKPWLMFSKFYDVKKMFAIYEEDADDDGWKNTRGTSTLNKDAAVKPKPTKGLSYKHQENRNVTRTDTDLKNKTKPNWNKPQPRAVVKHTEEFQPVPEMTVCKLQPAIDGKKKEVGLLKNKINSERKPLADILRSDLKTHNSFTDISKGKMTAGSKISPVMAFDRSTKRIWQENGRGYCFPFYDFKEDVTFIKNVEMRLDLETSMNSDRHLAMKFRENESTSASDSELLFLNEGRKPAKKLGKKWLKKFKQVQWKPEVDVIYFASNSAGEGDTSGEVLGRDVEPLREECEQQRKGFYSSIAPFPLENHLKDRWMSLLKV